MNLFRKLFCRNGPGEDLSTVLSRTYPATVHGVKFKLRKISPLDYVSGSKALHMHFDTWKSKGQEEQIKTLDSGTDKVKEHYKQLFMASVVEPKLKWKDDAEEPGIWVDNLFTDWDLATELYLAIMQVSYGKKKLNALIARRNALSK